MGQGGSVVIINATKYDWKRVNQHSYQMNSWNFPTTIAAGSKVSVYVEWDENIFHNHHDDGGEAEFQLEGTGGLSFEFQARWPEGGDRQIRVYFKNLSTPNNPKGSTISLGWAHDGRMNFVISGDVNYLNSTYAPQGWSWMSGNIGLLASRSLRTICMPGSHDTGMSTFGSHTAFAKRCNTLTQTKSIAGQLAQGARFFDIRPVISGGAYFTGHYSYIDSILGTQGANGQSIGQIVDEVNQFLEGAPELVVLKLSHDMNTDVGEPDYRAFTQQEWDGLLRYLEERLKYRYVNPGVNDLTTLKFGQFIGESKPFKPAVLVVIDPSDGGIQIPKSYLKTGFYPNSAFPIHDEYTGTTKVDHMAADQIQKMKKYRTSPNAEPFLLSWTLTQNTDDVINCAPEYGPNSIVWLANQANPTIYDKLWGALTPQTYPNVLYTDNVDSTLNLELALAITFFGASS